jgi:hypothetical protein
VKVDFGNCDIMVFIEKGNNKKIVVEIHKKWGRNMSFFLLAMNFNEILCKYLAILIIYKLIFMWYNIICCGTHGPIASPHNKEA